MGRHRREQEPGRRNAWKRVLFATLLLARCLCPLIDWPASSDDQ